MPTGWNDLPLEIRTRIIEEWRLFNRWLAHLRNSYTAQLRHTIQYLGSFMYDPDEPDAAPYYLPGGPLHVY